MAKLLNTKQKRISKPWKDIGELKCVLLSEKNQFEKATYPVIPAI
jgi:hypothetical protein